MWKDFRKAKPEIGSRLFVKMISGEVFYAIYSDEDEFDIHANHGDPISRDKWFKYSHRSVLKWRYFLKNKL